MARHVSTNGLEVGDHGVGAFWEGFGLFRDLPEGPATTQVDKLGGSQAVEISRICGEPGLQVELARHAVSGYVPSQPVPLTIQPQ